MNLQLFGAARMAPVADFVPAGISAVYSVAIGKWPSVSNSSVFTPTHRQRPAGCGVSLTGTPAAIVNRLGEEMRKSLARPETKERFKALGAVTVGDTPAEFAAFLKKDHERWARVIKTSGVTGQ